MSTGVSEGDDEMPELKRDKSLEAMFVDIPKVSLLDSAALLTRIRRKFLPEFLQSSWNLSRNMFLRA